MKVRSCSRKVVSVGPASQSFIACQRFVGIITVSSRPARSARAVEPFCMSLSADLYPSPGVADGVESAHEISVSAQRKYHA